MYKISWGMKSDRFKRKFLLVPDAETLFSVYFIITGYGRGDGCTPVEVRVSDLNGNEMDMSKGLSHIACRACNED